mmetsp:Transcript_14319/g.31160  ORF Transcript_14319/g.31160 Transcript_14319/m.31160 type:complete len:154 (-) Transcript_14319:115-576(-)
MRKKSAWLKWGAGKLFSDGEVNDLLDLVLTWQELVTMMLTEVLLKAVLDLNQEAIPYMQQSGPSKGYPVDMLSDPIAHIVNWTDPLFQHIGPQGITCVGIDPITMAGKTIPRMPQNSLSWYLCTRVTVRYVRGNIANYEMKERAHLQLRWWKN